MTEQDQFDLSMHRLDVEQSAAKLVHLMGVASRDVHASCSADELWCHPTLEVGQPPVRNHLVTKVNNRIPVGTGGLSEG